LLVTYGIIPDPEEVSTEGGEEEDPK
jgi:hypothetical protein